MADDPLSGIFGPPPDPLHDLFGPRVNPQWTESPLHDQTQAEAERELKDPAFAAKVAQQRTDDTLTRERNRARITTNARDSQTQMLAGGGGTIAAADQADTSNPAIDVAEGATAGWNATLAMMRQNRADFGITVHGPTKELLDASARAKAEADAFNAEAPDSGIAQVGYNIANLAASIFSSGKQAVNAAAAGATLGAAAGAAAGAPAGGIGAIPGAAAGAISGGAAGLTAGFIGDSYVTNAGQIMGDLREAGVDQQTAKSFGMAGGAIMAGLDLFGIGFAARPFVRAAERRAVQAEIASELKKRVLSETARDYFMGIIGETGAETAQQIVQDVTTDLAKQSTGGDYKTIFNDPQRRHEVVRNAVQTAVSVAEGMTVLGIPGVGVDAYRARKSSQAGSPENPTMQRGAELVTPEDHDSPLPTDLIQEGKGAIAQSLDDVDHNGILAAHGAPAVGKAVALTRGPNAAIEQGKVLGSFSVGDASGQEHGIRIGMNDGSTYEELFKDIESGGHSINELIDKYLPEATGTDPTQIRASPEVTQSESVSDSNRVTSADVLKSKMRRVESGGNDQATNPLSSASGRYQFTDGTWKQLGGDPALKNDPAEQERLMDKLIAQNSHALDKAGIQTSAGNLYLAHFLGAKGAIDALSDPNAEVDAKVQKSNPFAAGWTNAQLASWANRKMGGKAGAYTSNPNTAADRAWAERDQGADGEELKFDEQAVPAEEQTPAAAEGESYTAKANAKIEADASKVKVDVPAPSEGRAGILAMPGLKGRNRLQFMIKGEPGSYHAEAEYDVEGIAGGTGGFGDGGTPAEAAAQAAAVLYHHLSPAGFGSPATEKHRQTIDKMRSYLSDNFGVADNGERASQKEIAAAAPTPKLAPIAEAKPGEIINEAGQTLVRAGFATPQQAGLFLKNQKVEGTVEGYDDGGTTKYAVAAKANSEFVPFAHDSGTLGIPRDEMPQIKAEHRGAMVNFLNARGIQHEEETVQADSLKPTQAEFSPAKVEKALGFEGGDRAILVSQDGYVVDGHHQWLAAKQKGEDVRVIRLQAPIHEILQQAHAFPSSTSEAAPAQLEEQAGVSKAVTPPSTELTPAQFDQVWKSKPFKDAVDAMTTRGKEDRPHRESHVADDMVRGWIDGKANDLDKLRARAERPLVLADTIDRPENSFNPRQGYVEAFYAARTGKPREIRAAGGGRVFGVKEALAELEGKTPPSEPSPAQPSSDYGAKNRLVTRERADELRKRLKDKLSTQLNSGIDPEVLAMGTELAVFHIEAGARKFADFASAITSDLGLSFDQAKRFLRGWYNGARDMMEDAGAPVGDMDSPDQVRAELEKLATESTHDTLSTEEQSNAGASQPSSSGKDDRASDAGRSAGAVSGAEGERGAGGGAEASSGGSASELRSGDEPSAGSDRQVERPAAAQERQAGSAEERSGTDRNRPSRRVRSESQGTDFRASPGSLIRAGSWKATAERNLDIVALVKRIEAEERPATPDEQALLAKFTGWGASEIRNGLFPNNVVQRDAQTGERKIVPPAWGSSEWKPLQERAAELLKGSDLDEALQSTQYAHYTSPEVISSIWSGLERMGFEGGKVLEPGMGIGNFYMLAPNNVHEVSHYTGIEFDSITARIAKLLLPQESVIHGDYTKTKLPNGFFDVAIGNPPFANIQILDDPDYKKQRFSLHDYFFAKSIDKVRPGGLLVFVTSRFTMDKLDQKARTYIADRADLLGAVRLPQTAFKANAGTEVVTDVLFLQKRHESVPRAGEDWLGTDSITAGGQKFQINEYFKRHPEMVLGKHASTGSMYRTNDYTVEPHVSRHIGDSFARAVAALPIDVYTAAPRKAKEAAQARTFERDFAPASSKEGGLYVKDGKLFVVDQGSGVEAEQFAKLSPEDKSWLKGYTKLRDALKDAQKDQLQEGEWENSLAALNKEYRAFTKKHGQLLAFTKYERTVKDADGEETTVSYKRFKWQRLFDLDIESPLVVQLEKISDEDEIKEGAFLQGRTLNKPSRPVIESPEDALAVTLDEVGKLDVDYAAKLLGKNREEMIAALGDGIFEHPSDGWQTSDEYLSGFVIDKLEEARAAAATDSKFERNVQALLKVQPKPLPHSAITVKMGAGWIPSDIVQQFVTEELGVEGSGITYDRTSANWTVEGAKSRYLRHRITDYGTSERSPLELMDALLNNRSIKITRTENVDGSKRTFTDERATAAANEAAKKISDKFKSWIWTDAKRAGQLSDLYNRQFNNIAPRAFNGDHLTLPGLSANFAPHPHVKRAVWRIIQTGNTYLGHAVGAGKTAEQIISAMEQKRLGLIKKPMFVVPNHMLQQFAREFLELYPAAQIMVADEKAFHTDNRRRFMAQAGLNDPDSIIVTHSSFGKLGVSPQIKADIVHNMVMDLEDALESAKSEGQDGRLKRKKLEQQIEQMKRRIEGKSGAKDQTLTFEDMGVDMLYVDEAHEFRKLDFATNRQAKGIDSSGSNKALDLYIKTRWLEQQKPGRNLVLASGTPVTNTMAELYTVMRYMDEKGLERDGISSFDAWANMFGEVAAGYEQNAAGGYEIVERFSKFVNVPELMKRVRSFMDVLTSGQLGDLVQRPDWKGGLPKNEVVPASNHLERYMQQTLQTRLEVSRKWKPSKDQPGNPDPVINIITDARLASIDMRFALPSLTDDPGSKLNKMIDNIIRIYKDTSANAYSDPKTGTKDLKKGGVQIVFSAVGFGEQAMKNRGFDVRGWVDKRLQDAGVKKSEIAWMSDASSHAKKDALQKAVRSGQVRVLIGSPKNMGTGLNVQRRLYALHYLSPPWYPSDVEQPHGRIIRQGNLHSEVEGYWYATKGTYDSTAWGMVSRKQKFIEQAMLGDDSVRTLEDISESSQFEMAAALAAGDERVIKVAGLSGDVERLTRLRGAHADQQRELRYERNAIEKFQIPSAEKQIAELEKANAAKGGGFEEFSFAADGHSFEGQKEAGEHIIATIEQSLNDSLSVPTKELGKLYGKFPVTMEPADRVGGAFTVSVDVGGHIMEVIKPRDTATDLDPTGLLTRIVNKVREIPSSLMSEKGRLKEAEARIGQIDRKLGAPFEHEAELSEKIAEREILQAEMAAENAAKEKPKAAAGFELQTVTTEQEAKIKAELLAELNRLGIGDRISLQAANGLRLENKGTRGQYWNRVISVALDKAVDPMSVLHHEAVHAMKSLGLFTTSEWSYFTDHAWRDPDIRSWVQRNYRQLDAAGQREEAAAEFFAQRGRVIREMQAGGLMSRVILRIANFLNAVRGAFRKVLGQEAGISAAIASGKIGSRPTGFGEPVRDGPALQSVSPEFDEEIERRWQEANGVQVDGASVLDKGKAAFGDFVHGWSRHFEHLPNLPRFANVKEQLRKLEAAPEAAYEKTVRHLQSLVGSLNREEYDILKRKAVLDDLMWEADAEHQLPFGFTPETLREARIRVDGVAATLPKVTEAIRARKLANRRLGDELVKSGVLRSDQIKNPAYYRHMVLDYARAQIEAAQNGGTVLVNGKPVRVRTPYWARRKGSQMDINSNLLEAEADWMLKAHTDIQTARSLDWIAKSEHNIREQLRTRARSENDDAYAEALKMAPEAKKEDTHLRQLMRYGFEQVKSVLESTDLNIPAELQDAADAIVAGSRDTPSFPLLTWLMDEKKPGAQGAAMILSGIGGRKKLMRQLLGDKFADPEDVAGLVKHYRPEGFVDWQPREGQHLFTGKTVSEHVLDMFVSKLGDQVYPGVDKLELERALSQIRPQLVVGGARYTMVIPQELASTLNDFGDKNSHNLFLRAVAGLQGKWKQYILINPRRWFRYNFNNMTGDLDAIIAGKPSSLLKVGAAFKELYAVSRGSASPSEAYKEALDRGVFQAGITRQEVPDINQFSAFRHLSREKAGLRPDRMAVQAVSNLWHALKGSTQFRETLFRYAAYLQYKEDIDAGKDQKAIGYGGSNPALVDAVKDPADRAALLSRELVGDYGDISVFGARMRRYVMPFWSWPEINTKRYFRLTANAFRVSAARGLATGGLLGAGVAARSAATLIVRMALVYGLINLWNNWLHGDDERKLDDQQRHQLHLILGHDDKGQVYTLRMQGALSDVLDELGFADTSDAFRNWEDGKGSFGEILTATPKAIINRVGPGNWNPLYMEPIQLALREKLWPDLFNPRTIHDRARDVAQTFSLENEYDWAAGKPSQGYGRSWLQSFAYQRDPGEMAYNNTRDLIGQWMKEKEGLDIGRANISPRSEALRDYKMALRFGDQEAAHQALEEYAKYEGTARGLKESIKAAAPLHALPKKDRRAFIESLTDDQRTQLIDAQRFYEEVYLGRKAKS